MLHTSVPPYPQSPWSGVIALPPGYTSNGLNISGHSHENLETAIREAIVNACPDGSAAVSFSGGVDSTLLAALAKEEGISVRPVTIRFHKNDPDTENAINIARALKLDLEIINFDVDEALSGLQMISDCELPTSDSSALPTFLLAKRVDKLPILDGVGADGLYPSLQDIDRQLLLGKIPRAVRLLTSIPFRMKWKNSDLVRKINRLGQTAPVMNLAWQYSGKLYTAPKNLDFIDKWFSEASSLLGHRLALIAQGVAFRSMGSQSQKYTAINNSVSFPFVEAADLTGRYLHDTEPKHHLKQMLCKYVPRDYVYRKKYGFSMNYRSALTTDVFIEETKRAFRNLDSYVLNGDWVVKSLIRNDPLPWYIYGTIWSIVCLNIWLESQLNQNFLE